MNYPERYLVTAALPYANGPLHIGHLAGAYIPSDIYVRFQRMMGKDVVYICGSDENGAAITLRALKEGKKPKEIVDEYDASFRKSFKGMGISFDMFHRTSDSLHHETAKEFFKTLYDQGEFKEEVSEQYYDDEAKQFLADRYIKGTCPKCGHDSAYGDQCENCGSTLSPIELIDPISTITGTSPILKATKHWYLPLDKYEGWLREWITDGIVDGEQLHDTQKWKNHVLGQCKSWLDGGLQPRSMTRDLDWGVDVPQSIEGAEGKKLYVWMDAPIGYISATKEWAKQNGKNWEEYWKDDKSELIHFIGKDNIVFHCLIFPSILKAHGGYILPKNVPANQFMNLEGDKISTSRNWAVWVHEYLEDFKGQQDELRYYLIKNMPELKDSEFTWAGFQEMNNNELVNNLANFVNRVVVLSNKYYDGIVPDFDPDLMIIGPDGEAETAFHDSEILRLFDGVHVLCQHIRDYDFRAALSQLMLISTKGNQILQFNEPWKLQKTDPETVKVVMNLALHYVAVLSTVMRPFLPFTSDKLQGILNLDAIKEEDEMVSMLDILAAGEPLLNAGHKIGQPVHLFSRIDDAVIEAQKAKLVKPVEEALVTARAVTIETTPIKEEIAFDDFMKLDIRTATILTAEKVKKADKLLKLEVDMGSEQRTVVSGIAEHYTPEEVIGKRVSILANLASRKIRGVESKGMILMAEDADGKLSFVSPEDGWQNGATVC